MIKKNYMVWTAVCAVLLHLVLPQPLLLRCPHRRGRRLLLSVLD